LLLPVSEKPMTPGLFPAPLRAQLSALSWEAQSEL
jgi:hypothetical protein